MHGWVAGLVAAFLFALGGTVPVPSPDRLDPGGAGRTLVASRFVPVARAEPTGYVKYYTVVASYQGKPENLRTIAARFLGDAQRAGEIFDLNVGRAQPAGGKLSDPDVLRTGWYLVLPWDAVGEGIRYGLLPLQAPKQPTPPMPPRTTAPGGGNQGPSQQPSPGASASVPATPPPSAPPSGAVRQGCVTASAVSTSAADWGHQRMDPDQAWTRTKGTGVTVAVVDSGVDATVPQLADRVLAGADIVTGSSRGDTDCLGSGTAIAGIIAGRPATDDQIVGMAPEATILPVRLVEDRRTQPGPQDEASAIEIAVSAGAQVIALGGYVDPEHPAVAAAIRSALEHDVVVVAPARTKSPGTGGAASSAPAATGSAAPAATGSSAAAATPLSSALLRVGGLGVDEQLAADHPAGAIDVVAPGIDVRSVGIGGTGAYVGSGTEYAVAFVAGAVALVRSGYPDLTAAQVAHRIRLTASRMGAGAPDPQYGWGLINPNAAVTETVAGAGEGAAPASADRPGTAGSQPGAVLVLVAFTALTLLIGAVVVLRLRRAARVRAAVYGSDTDELTTPDVP